jgi:Tfp pilus assembly protein PilV
MTNLSFKTRGLTLVEVLISAALILIAVVALFSVHNLYLKTALSNSDSIKAAYLAEEGVEAVRFWRNSSWNNKIETIPLDTPYGLTLSGNGWATTTNRYIGNFERSITLSAVYRDASSDIVSSGGTLDSNTLLVTSSVSWVKGGATSTKSIATYLTNIYDN